MGRPAKSVRRAYAAEMRRFEEYHGTRETPVKMGPTPKAKYYPVTDSGKYREGKVKRTPWEGSEIGTETLCLQAAGAQVTVCFL